MADEVKYPQVARMVAESAWAIELPTLVTIVDVVAYRAAGHRLSAEEIQARVGAGPASRGVVQEGPVAVLPLYGVIVPRANVMSDVSGGTSAQVFLSDLRGLLADDSVRAIVIDVNSPGGSTAMMPEVAAAMRAARGNGKPIVASVNHRAGSGAYWLASQADEVVVTPSGEVGSIGVYAAHEDISQLQERAGIRTTLISSTPAKTELTPFGPLSEEARRALQERVDEAARMFVSDVAKGRGVGVDTVNEDFGRGRMVSARAALAAGMVDRIDTLDSTVARAANPKGRSRMGAREPGLGAGSYVVQLNTTNDHAPPPTAAHTDLPEAAASGLSFADEADAARGAAEALVGRLDSLAEVERGRLTATKREQLAACPGAFRAAADRIDAVLAATDPNRHQPDLVRERLRFERARFVGGTR